MQEKPLVAIFNRRFHSIYGAQANVIRLASLMETDERVMLTTSRGEFQNACISAGVRCEIVETPQIFKDFGGKIFNLGLLGKLLLPLRLLFFNLRLWRAFRLTGARILLLTDVQSLPFAILICLFSSSKVFVYVQGDDTGPVLRFLAGVLVDRILLIAKSLEAPFRASCPWCVKRLKVLYSGFPMPDQVDLADDARCKVRMRFLSDGGIPEDAKIIGLAGSVTYRKGGDLLLLAAAKILESYPDTYFVFFGSVSPGHESFMDDLVMLIQRHKLSQRVVFAGFQPRHIIFSCVDILVLPSRSEGLPSVLIEALSFGIGVVASDIAGAREIIRFPYLGQLVRAESPDALADAITSKLQEINEQGHGQNVKVQCRREFARENFSNFRYVREFRTACHELLHG